LLWSGDDALGEGDAVADEDHGERLDRELIELLNELRVVLPGAQVLFAFLLTVPFTQHFPKLSDLQRDVYFAAFITTAVASVLLMTPSAFHRLRWRRGDKERLLVLSNKFAIAGLVLLAVAIALVVFVVTDVVFDSTSAAIATGLIAASNAVFWFVVPLSGKSRDAG
jgi:predicted neutral ceramidase superfamily lipid hydrolase